MGSHVLVPAVDTLINPATGLACTPSANTGNIFEAPPVYSEYQPAQLAPASDEAHVNAHSGSIPVPRATERVAESDGRASASIPVPRVTGRSVAESAVGRVPGPQIREDSNPWWTVFEGDKQGVYSTR